MSNILDVSNIYWIHPIYIGYIQYVLDIKSSRIGRISKLTLPSETFFRAEHNRAGPRGQRPQEAVENRDQK